MESDSQNTNNLLKARWLQRTANGLSYTRMIAGPILFAHIARGRYRSWKTASAIGLLAASDGLDGRLARKALTYDPSAASEHGAWADQMADKVLTHAIIGGLATNAFREGSIAKGSTLLANQAVQAVRDVLVTKVRRQATEHGVSTKAKGLGKLKAAVLMGACIELASPLATTSVGECIGNLSVAAGTGLAVVSGVSLTNSLREGIEVARQTEEAHPDDALHDAVAVLP